ncbi:MAG: hypothetical protein PUD55_06645 [Firmicutes bacterium]|nr:hypothetical protein [Bacillota bacterium]
MKRIKGVTNYNELHAMREVWREERRNVRGRIARLPKGSLCVAANGTYYQKQYTTDCPEEIEKLLKKGYRVKRQAVVGESERYVFYVPKQDERWASRALERMHLENLLAGLELSIDCVTKILDFLETLFCVEESMLGHSEKKRLLELDEAAMRKELEAWANADYPRNPLHTDKLIHPTKKGDYVRSKSEVKIADMLYDAGIPYRYEMEESVNGHTYYTDFVVRHPVTGRFYRIEHCGMMDSPEYIRKIGYKLMDYSMEGYLNNKDFFMTTETSKRPLETRDVQMIIDRILNDEVVGGADNDYN